MLFRSIVRSAFSTLGMRIQNEQSGSSSLFAHPLVIEPIPEETGNKETGNSEPASGTAESVAEPPAPAKLARGVLEARLDGVQMELMKPTGPPHAVVRQGHLALLKRWYYRPETRRPGEIFFPDPEGHWPVKAILRGIGRIAAKSLTASADR